MNDGLRDPRFTDDRPTRSLLLSLLTEACELEHGLACCYLFAAFSLKKELTEPGMNWERQRLTRMWAAQIFMVAAQEMQHLAEAWNLLTAIGGTAYYGRPPFPQTSKYYQLRRTHSPRLELTAFSRETLDRFILFEEPDSVAAERQAPLGFDTIGGLYRRVEAIIGELDERTLFLGDPAHQVGRSPRRLPRSQPRHRRRRARSRRSNGSSSKAKAPARTARTRTSVCSAPSVSNSTKPPKTWGEFSPARPVVANPIVPRRAGQVPDANPIQERGRRAVSPSSSTARTR